MPEPQETKLEPTAPVTPAQPVTPTASTPESVRADNTRQIDVKASIDAAINPIQRELEDQKMARKYGLNDEQLDAVKRVRSEHPTMDFEKASRFARIEKPELFPSKPPAYQPAHHGVIPPGGDSPVRGGINPSQPDPNEKMREAVEKGDRRGATYWAHQAFAARIAPYSTTRQQ